MPRSSRPLELHPIVLRTAEVAAITDITPHMRRLRLTGPDLHGGVRDGVKFGPFVSNGFDDHIKMVFPDANGYAPNGGVQQEKRVDWNPEAIRQSRDYTVRTVTDDYIDVDLVRHDGGLAAAWAFNCRIGDKIQFAGPKTCGLIPEGIDWYLLLADETALPAVARFLEEAAPGTRVRAFIEIPEVADKQDFDTQADVEVTWLVRADTCITVDGRERTPLPGFSPLLQQALREFEFWPGRPYVWASAETMTLIPIRKYLRRELGLPAEDVEIAGYWRRVENKGYDHADSGDDDSAAAASTGLKRQGSGDEAESAQTETAESPMDLILELHEMSELLPPLLLRWLVTLGIPELLLEGPMSAAALEEELQLPQARLLPILDAAVVSKLLQYKPEPVAADGSGAAPHSDPDIAGGRYANTDLSALLADPETNGELNLNIPMSRWELSLFDLLSTVKTGEPVPARHPGGLFVGREDAETEQRYQEFCNQNFGSFDAGPLAEIVVAQGVKDVTLIGDGLGAVLDALRRANPQIHVNIADSVTAITAGESEVPVAEMVVGVLALDSLSDSDRESMTQQMAAAAGKFVLLSSTTREVALTNDHMAVANLVRLGMNGATSMSLRQLGKMLTDSGLELRETKPCGWGYSSYYALAAKQ